MKPTTQRTLVYGSLGAVCVLALLPPGVSDNQLSWAGAPAEQVRLPGVIRDFSRHHLDFNVTAGGDYVHTAGNVELALGFAGRPVFRSGGYVVDDPWRDSVSRPIAPHLAAALGGGAGCTVLADTNGDADGPSDGAISSAGTFAQWFRDIPGVNQSAVRSITLTRDGDGTYAYVDDDFHPIDDALLGNEGFAHNYFFTYAIETSFTYDACTGQYIEFEGGDGAWLYVDGALVLDLGGVDTSTEQHVELDRLDLADGATVELKLFYAQRQTLGAVFRLRTNVALAPAGTPPTISAMFD